MTSEPWPSREALEQVLKSVVANRERADALREHAMWIIQLADNSSDTYDFRTLLYAQASAYLALESNERTYGVINHSNPVVDEYFKQFGAQND